MVHRAMSCGMSRSSRAGSPSARIDAGQAVLLTARAACRPRRPHRSRSPPGERVPASFLLRQRPSSPSGCRFCWSGDLTELLLVSGPPIVLRRWPLNGERPLGSGVRVGQRNIPSGRRGMVALALGVQSPARRSATGKDSDT
jgi:hypothetical protein